MDFAGISLMDAFHKVNLCARNLFERGSKEKLEGAVSIITLDSGTFKRIMALE